MVRSKRPSESFRYALNGVLLSFKSQRQLRAHFILALLALFAGFVWQLSRTELAILTCTIFLVIMAELFNTAVETVVDLVTPDYHPLAKIAKDVAAGAVLVVSINAVLVGMLLFLDPAKLTTQRAASPPGDETLRVLIIGFLMLLIALVVWKVRGGKGRFLQGGVVSGHTAIAFFLATVISLVSQHPLTVVLALLLAALVSQSRVEARIHSLQEVLFGALLGTALPVLLYRVVPLILQQLARGPAGAGS
ncbi:MAG: diacylglycerol kinase [Armatimonadota bacterium]